MAEGFVQHRTHLEDIKVVILCTLYSILSTKADNTRTTNTIYEVFELEGNCDAKRSVSFMPQPRPGRASPSVQGDSKASTIFG